MAQPITVLDDVTCDLCLCLPRHGDEGEQGGDGFSGFSI